MTKPFPRFQLKTYFALVLLAIGLGNVLTPATARAEPAQTWSLSVASGQVRLVKSGLTPIALTVGDVFTKGDWIETGPDGRAILQRGSETIVVAPNSRIGLPEKNDGPFLTRILQTLGTILLTVEKKARQHFEVQTPYMAAVVKGTTFTVSIQGQRAVVHVVEGLVEVRNLNNGLSSIVRPGQTGSVLRKGKSGVSIEGAQPSTGTSASAAPTEAPAQQDQTETTLQLAAQETNAPSPDAIVSTEPDLVIVNETLGPSDIDLTVATGGLVREAAVDGVSATQGGGKGISTPVSAVSDVAAASLSMPNDLAISLVFNGTGNSVFADISDSGGAGGGGAGGGGGGCPPPC